MSKSKKFRKLSKAAKMGKPYAQYQLGLCYQTGQEVVSDMQMAAAWIKLAAESGYAAAKDWLADYAFDDDAKTQAHA